MTVAAALYFSTLQDFPDPYLELIQNASQLALSLSVPLVVLLHCGTQSNLDELAQHMDTPLTVWKDYQILLSKIYSKAAKCAFNVDMPLFECTVVPAVVCQYDVWQELTATHFVYLEQGLFKLIKMKGGMSIG